MSSSDQLLTEIDRIARHLTDNRLEPPQGLKLYPYRTEFLASWSLIIGLLDAAVQHHALQPVAVWSLEGEDLELPVGGFYIPFKVVDLTTGKAVKYLAIGPYPDGIVTCRLRHQLI